MAITFVGAVSYDGTAASTTQTITVPTVANGDTALFFYTTASAATVINSMTGIAGAFTAVGARAGVSGHSSWVFTAPLTAADSGATITTTIASAARATIVLAVYRGVSATTPVGAFNSSAASPSLAAVPTPAVTAATGAVVEVGAVFWSNSTTAITTITAPDLTVIDTAYPTVAGGTIAAAVGHNLTPLSSGGSAGARVFTSDQAKPHSEWTLTLRPVNTAPSAGAGSDQTVAVNAAVTLTGTASDADGTVASAVWSQLSGPSVVLGGSGLVRTFTPTVGGVYVFRLTVTDDSGVTVTDDVTVLAQGTASAPYNVASNAGGWTNQGAAVDIPAALADSSDTTFAETPDAPDGAVMVVDMSPLQAGVVTVTTRDRATVSSPVISRKVEILNGATVLQTSTFNLTTVWVNHTLSTPSSVAASAPVKVRITDTQA